MRLGCGRRRGRLGCAILSQPGRGGRAVEGGGLESNLAREIGLIRRPAELTTLMQDVPTPQWVRLAGASSLTGACGITGERWVTLRP